MKIRLEYLVIALLFIVVAGVIEIFLLRSALVNEISNRQKVDYILTNRMSTNNARIQGIYHDYQTLNIKYSDQQTELNAIRIVMNNFKFFPVRVIKSVDKKLKKPKRIKKVKAKK